MKTEKGKALSKWVPNDDYLNSYDRIFKKDQEIDKVPDDCVDDKTQHDE